MQKMMGLVRRCIEDYNMIEAGDRIAVGVEGASDALVSAVKNFEDYVKRETLALELNFGALSDVEGSSVQIDGATLSLFVKTLKA